MGKLMSLTIVNKNLGLIYDIHFREFSLWVPQGEENGENADDTESHDNGVVLSHILPSLFLGTFHHGLKSLFFTLIVLGGLWRYLSLFNV